MLPTTTHKTNMCDNLDESLRNWVRIHTRKLCALTQIHIRTQCNIHTHSHIPVQCAQCTRAEMGEPDRNHTHILTHSAYFAYTHHTRRVF